MSGKQETVAAAAARLDRERSTPAGAGPCPCCGKPAKNYEAQVGKPQVEELLRFIKKVNERIAETGVGKLVGYSIHVPTQLGEGAKSYSQNCLSTWKHWGIVEPDPAIRGHWKLTRWGREFMLGELSIMTHASCWRDSAEEFFGEDCYITDILPKAKIDEILNG